MPDKSKQAIIDICKCILHEMADANGNMYPAAYMLLQQPQVKARLTKYLKELHNTIKLCQPTIKKQP